MGVVEAVSAVAVVAGLLTAVLTLRHRSRPGPARPVAAMLLVAVAWTAVGLAFGAVEDVATKTAVFRLIFPIGGMLAGAVLWHALVLARGTPGSHRRLLLLLLAEPVVVGLLAAVDAAHPVLLGSTGPSGTSFLIAFRPLAWVHIAYCLLAVVVALVLMDRARRAAIPAHRARYVVAMLALVLPTVGAVVSVIGASTFGAVDLTGALSVVTAGIWWWTGSRGDATASLPISLRQVLHALGDAVVVVDAGGRVVMANAAAEEMIGPAGLNGSTGLRPVGRLHGSHWSDLVDTALWSESWNGRRVVTATGRVLDVRVAVVEPDEPATARVVTARDVTEVERLRAELAEQAVRDGLTGLHNRRYLDRVLADVVADAHATGRPLSAAMVDLDHFKAVNDEHGHAVGDAVLARIAAELTGCVRPCDVLVRFGGEEFLVLLPGAGIDAVRARAESCRVHLRSVAVATSEGPVRITVSVGVAGLVPGATGDALLRAADDALYEAKATGRDRVVAAPAVPAAAGTGRVA